VLGVGTEIVECLRVGRMVERHGEEFLARVFTPGEVRHCQSRRRAMEKFAALWAAKQAVLKALGLGGLRGVSWPEIEVHEEPAGASVTLRGQVQEMAGRAGARSVALSMSHCRAYATATALALG
jgi:holo-[acyl-carrier protein] synthase